VFSIVLQLDCAPYGCQIFFSQRDMAEEVYVSQLLGFIREGKEAKVMKLHKALYGLRQAPKAWNSRLDTELHKLGFIKCKSEHGLYTRVKNKHRLIVGVYVDNLIIMGESTKEVSMFKAEMKNIFHMSDLGILSYYLGIEVKQDDRGISLSQRAYAAKLLERASMTSCNSCVVPMEAKLKLSKEGDSPLVDPIEYRSLIGRLRYLLHTRPKLTFKQDHMSAIKHLLWYVAATVDYGLFYPRGCGGRFGVLGYNDNDLAGDTDGSKIT
jgi:hypothetical protein